VQLPPELGELLKIQFLWERIAGSSQKSNFLPQSPSKHQVRRLMFEDSVKKAEAEARAEVADSRAKNCLQTLR
jgi:hypothetical protein